LVLTAVAATCVAVGVAVDAGVDVRVAVVAGVAVRVAVGVRVGVRVGTGVAVAAGPVDATFHPMSSRNSSVSAMSWSSPVYDGSITSFGVSVVSTCETDEPDWNELGAYMWMWPLGPTPEVNAPLSASANGPA